MKLILRKLRRVTRIVLLIVQLLSWLLGLGDAAEPAQPPRAVDTGQTVGAPAGTSPAGPAVSPGPSIR